MKKVLLVDDEILIRETIRDCIDWEKEGFIYCGDAPDGEVALPLIEQVQPDIIITDILMPFMNGLELSSIVRKKMPDVKIIILTGHGEFEYARSALRMGVEEYCLKPLSAAEIITMLQVVSTKIDKEREEKARIEKLKQTESDKEVISQDKLLNDLCSGFIMTSEAIHLSTSLHLSLLAHYYVVAMMDIRYPGPSSSIQSDTLQESELLLIDTCRSLQQNNHHLMFQRSRTETVWILKGDSLDQLQQELQSFKETQQMISEESSGISVSVSVGIGSVQDRLQNVHLSFLEAEEDMHWRRLSRQNRHALRESFPGLLDPSLFLDRGKFVDFLKIGSPTQLEPFIKEYAIALKDINWHAAAIGYYILNDLTLEVFRSAKDMYRHLSDPEETLNRLQQQIGTIRSWQDTCFYLTELTEQFWSWRSRLYDKYGEMLIKVKEYIQCNYDKDSISLQVAAEHVEVSASHLSKVFSQETGQTFIEYLTQTRIRKAMELLKTTSAKSFEIAYQVGYNDAHYFSNLFKRVTGMTTKEFRKNGLHDASLSRSEGEQLRVL
ncbi:response regulator [Paenibacillus sp. V4I5]|uniref:response regulator transcription factor n=1 Tax=Paenibacillus sp. V4I5 TaxID=3042306 RepID=UPI0027902835|nr:response regulator [Paenibacillus sp. V4I5]MDQ0920550.1 two-component system response regulator YesN [Paenibacillus sp. V4I5]